MKLPSNYQKYMSMMYDKKVLIYSPIEDVDEELNVSIKKGKLKEILMGNAHITSKEANLKDFGITLDAKMYITCSDTKAKEYDFAIYEDKEYKVVGIIKNDSHTKVFLNGT